MSDAGRGIARIDYDLQNNPVRIQFTDGSVTKYIYSAAGEKLGVEYRVAAPNVTVAFGSFRELAPSEIQSADSTDYLLGGSLTLRNGRIDKLQFEEGYCQASAYSGNASQDDIYFYYYDRDHLGSIRQVVLADRTTNGTVVQTMDYYPFGAQFCHSSTVSEVQPYKYNGKEFDKMHGLNTYDYGARQYNPVTARWDRMDPLCEKYYSVSPYAYCHNNPVMMVDPDGRDEWEINSQGQLMNRITTDEHDAFFIVDDNNERIEGKSISFEHGFIKRTFKSHTRTKEDIIENGKTIEKETKQYFDVYEMRGDANSTKLFEFLADNTSVEWSQMRFGVKGENGLNVLTTSHIEDTDYGSTSMLNKQYLFGYTMREHIHSHPRNTPKPSGFGEYEGKYDMEFARNIQGIRPNVLLKIYLPKSKSYINYSKDSTINDF